MSGVSNQNIQTDSQSQYLKRLVGEPDGLVKLPGFDYRIFTPTLSESVEN